MPTSLTLLERLQRRPTEADWERLYAMYGPLIRRWVLAALGPLGEASDIAQEVMLAVIRDIPEFEHRGGGSFRGWLRGIAANRLREHYRARDRMPAAARSRADDFLDRLADPVDRLAAEWDLEHDRCVLRELLGIVENDFESATFNAFRLVVLGGRRPSDVAAETGLSLNAVLLAKSRVLKRLRLEAGAFLD